MDEAATRRIDEGARDATLFDYVLGRLSIELDGRPVFDRRSDPSVSEEGALCNVAVLKFVWNFSAVCGYVLSSGEAEEIVPITDRHLLGLDREGQDVRVRVMMRDEDGSSRDIAVQKLTLQQLAEACRSIGETSVDALLHRNPDLIANPQLRRLRASVESLAASRDRGREASGSSRRP